MTVVWQPLGSVCPVISLVHTLPSLLKPRDMRGTELLAKLGKKRSDDVAVLLLLATLSLARISRLSHQPKGRSDDEAGRSTWDSWRINGHPVSGTVPMKIKQESSLQLLMG